MSRLVVRRLKAIAGVLTFCAYSAAAVADSFVTRNANASGTTPAGFYRGLPHYQDNEPSCKLNVRRPRNIICAWDGYNGADDAIGDAWIKLGFSDDNGRTWLNRYATGSPADPLSSIGQQFAADPITICWAGGCGVVFIASTREGLGGTGGGVYLQLLPEFNIEAGFSHLSEQGPRVVQLGTGDTFLDKIDAIFIPETDSPGTVEVTMTVEKGGGETELVTRQWPAGRILVVYAAINSSEQNIRVYSTYTDNFGGSWSAPKQVANTTGLDTGVAVSAIGDTVFYGYRQFSDPSGGNADAIYGAVSRNGGRNIGKPFPIVPDLCPNDQPTLPNADAPDISASRTNGFVSISNNGEFFAMTYPVRRRAPDGSCVTEPPFEFPSDSRVMLVTSPASGSDWGLPVPLAPREEHGFQFMPTLECSLGVCQALWYDTVRDSQRAISFLEALGDLEARDAFVNFPLFADWNFGRLVNGVPQVVQFRRTADAYTRQFSLDSTGAPVFADPEPVRVSRFQLALIGGELVEAGQIPFHIKAYKGNSVAYMGDYIDLATEELRPRPDSVNADGPPVYESNRGVDPLEPTKEPKFLAVWTDTRNQRGQIYTGNIEQTLPYQKTAPGAGMAQRDEPATGVGDPELLPGGRKLSAEGVDDSNPGAGFCAPTPPLGAGELFIPINNRIKDSDVYTAWIEPEASAWVFNPTKDLGDIQRSYVIAARNESLFGRTFRFEIVNQPVGAPELARASWEQLPFTPPFSPFDPPATVITEPVGPQSSVTVALFLVSDEPVNPVTVNILDDASGELVDSVTVNGALEAGSFLNPDGTINLAEIHNPEVIAPDIFNPDIFNPDIFNPDIFNPDIFNPDIFNPDIFNPDIFNPDIFNPDIFNPDIFNPDIFNPDIFNPDIFNATLVDADNLDNPEIAEPDLSPLNRQPGEPIAKFDVAFSVVNTGNTLTPYVADFALASELVLSLIESGDVATQLIVSQQAQTDDYQFCEPRQIPQNRIVAVENNINLGELLIPDIFNNRFGSITFYIAPGADVTLTLRFLGRAAAIKQIAPELASDVISHVVTSQVANTGEVELATNREQSIRDVTRAVFNVADGDVLTLPAEGPAGATLPLGLVTATKGEFEIVPVDCDPALGSVVPLGPNPVSCSATASNGITSTVDFTVSVEDFGAPSFDPGSVPADTTIERGAPLGAVFDYLLPTASDVVDQDVDVVCAPVGPGGQAPFTAPGPTTTTITCIATDDAGLTDEASFDVTVADTTAPALSLPLGIAADATGADGAAVAFSPVPSAVDLGVTDVPVSCTAFTPAVAVVSGSLFPIGATTVTCTAVDDAGNAALGQFVVTVSDLSSPSIDPSSVPTSPFAVEANAPTGYVHPAGAPPLYEVTASDAVDGTIVAACIPGGTSDFTFGITPVTCTASDSTGNSSPSVAFDVAVADTTAPVFTLGEPTITRTITSSSVIIDYLANVSVTDNADGILTPVCLVDGTVVPNPFEFAADSTSTVSCTATDASGNESTAAFDVVVSFAYTTVIQPLKGNVNSGSTAAIDWHYEDPVTGERVDTSAIGPMVSWFGPYAGRNCGGVSNGLGDGFAAEDAGNSDFRFSFADFSWRLNWQTPLVPGWYRVVVAPPGSDASTFCKQLR